MREALIPAALPKPRFCYSPVIRAGGIFQFAGMIALDPATGRLEPGGPGPETARILANLRGALAELGLTLGDLVLARIYTTAFDRFPAINEAWEAVFADGEAPPPARTSVGVMALPLGASVEIEFMFHREDPR